MQNQISPYHELGLQDAKIERLRSAIREIEGIADDAADDMAQQAMRRGMLLAASSRPFAEEGV